MVCSRTVREILVHAALFAPLAACDGEDDPAVGPTQLREQNGNAPALNGWQLNGWQLNGWQLNGWQLNGWQLNGWQLNGWQLNNVTLSGSLFTGTQVVDGATVTRSGLDFKGSQITLLHDGVEYTLRIDDIYKNPANPNGDVYFYRISVLDNQEGTWSSLCLNDQGQPTEAIPLTNRWDAATGARIDDANSVTIACRGGVLAKCVEWGYRPWASAQACSNGNCPVVPLRDYHQACTRMARADYCGDGTPHTFTGTPIDIYDKLVPAVQTEGTQNLQNWKIEAEWGPNGALCVGSSLRLSLVGGPTPSCLAALSGNQLCGTLSPGLGAKLANKYCSLWTTDLTKCGGVYEDYLPPQANGP